MGIDSIAIKIYDEIKGKIQQGKAEKKEIFKILKNNGPEIRKEIAMEAIKKIPDVYTKSNSVMEAYREFEKQEKISPYCFTKTSMQTPYYYKNLIKAMADDLKIKDFDVNIVDKFW